MGAALLAKLPKRVWGKSRNVTDNSPTRLEALRAALSHPKHIEVSWVWLAIVILDNVKCTLRGENSSDFPYRDGFKMKLIMPKMLRVVTGPRIDEDCVVSICSTSQSTSILGAYDIGMPAVQAPYH